MVLEMESNLQNAYRDAYHKAHLALSKFDPDQVCMNTRAVFDPASHTYRTEYLYREIRFDLDTGRITSPGHPDPTTPEGVLILHYLAGAASAHLAGKWISFREIPGAGNIYYPAFEKRAVRPLVKTFDSAPSLLPRAARALGGEPGTLGHASAVLHILPLVPVAYVVWQGDPEIPGSGTILFDSSISSFLPGEDAVLAASYGAYALIAASKNLKGAAS